MGLSNLLPDDDCLIQCALKQDVINNFLCRIDSWTESEIHRCPPYLHIFGLTMVELLNIDISTKLRRFMRHVDHHLVHLGCICNGSSGENEMSHKQFKVLYKSTNKHIDAIEPQLFTAWVPESVLLDHNSSSDNDSDTSVELHV